MNRSIAFLVILLSACSYTSRAQQADSLFNDFELSELDSIFSFQDSLSIFNLIDSLLQSEGLYNKSSMAFRLGYNSNATGSGRTLGIDQFGLSPGISYYHKSGAYMDASGYWSNEYEPSYYLTILSAGYLGAITNKWSILAEYSRYFYSDLGPDVVVAYENSLGVSNFIDVKPLTFRLDYTLLFGEKTGHRIMPGVMLNLEKRNWKGFDRILFYPSFNLLLGSEQYEQYLPYARTLIGSLIRVRNGLPLYYLDKGTDFGIMNYSFSLPLSMNVGNWNFLLSYAFNIPKALSNEQFQPENSGFITASVTRYIRFK
ncbi:MAG TPA: hypothetical protein DIS90_15810 [Cytophagales bacterium]|nr:hypothetical protein [Cytophagales bacterium]